MIGKTKVETNSTQGRCAGKMFSVQLVSSVKVPSRDAGCSHKVRASA